MHTSLFRSIAARSGLSRGLPALLITAALVLSACGGGQGGGAAA